MKIGRMATLTGGKRIMGRKLITLGIMLGVLGTGVHAGAVVLTFDDVFDSGYGSLVPVGYGGLNWSNMYVLNSTDCALSYGNNGFASGTYSGTNVAFNGFGTSAQVTGDSFDFNGVYLTGAWNDGLSIEVRGWRTRTVAFDRTVTVNTDAPTWFVFNYEGIDGLTFTSWGGSTCGYDGEGPQFAMDNFTYNESTNNPVPEPGTMVLLGSGLLVLVGAVRWRSKKG
jgi:hypothetical protein